MIAQLLLSTGRALHQADQKQREALETQRRAVEIKNEFVSMVSHELRTPLTSIAGFTDALRESWANLTDREVEEFLVIMRRETGHLRDLVEDILVIPRLETGHLRMDAEELDLRKETFDIADLVFQDSPMELDISIPAAVMVHADPVRLRQVLRNLLENAIKYGGDQVLVDGRLDGSHFRMVVTDNGPGVPESDRERIFDHFEQLTKGDSRVSQGVGLGLPIARKLVRAMGGDLWFEARFPTGSRFCFTIPMADVPQPVAEGRPV
jgi:signal transduction histidine kinase